MVRISFFALAAFAMAQTAASAAEKVVEVDRTRLADPAYVEALYVEIESAARSVCKKDLAGSPLYMPQLRACVAKTVKDAVKQVDAPMLTAYADGEALPERLAANQ
jgi:UrcA family protein